MRIDPCPICGRYIDIPSDHDKEKHMDYKTVNEGDIIRLKNGNVVTVEDINPNEDWDKDEEIWAEATSTTGYYDVELYPDMLADAELVMNAAQVAARSLPTAAKLLGHFDFDGWDDFRHTDTEFDGDQAYITVRTSDELTVQFTVTVSDVHLADF